MLKIFSIACISFCSFLFSGWHSWDTEPKDGQLHMVVKVVPGLPVEERQTLIISDYDKYHQLHRGNGWWDVTKKDLEKWLNEGSKVYYLSEIDKSLMDALFPYFLGK